MTTSATTVPAAATTGLFVKAPWMRALILNMFTHQGFTHVQLGSFHDQYTKGSKVVDVTWSNVVTGASITEAKGKAPKVLQAGHQGKLQILTNASGHKTMTTTQKWAASDYINGKGEKVTLADLKAQAEATFKLMDK